MGVRGFVSRRNFVDQTRSEGEEGKKRNRRRIFSIRFVFVLIIIWLGLHRVVCMSEQGAKLTDQGLILGFAVLHEVLLS